MIGKCPECGDDKPKELKAQEKQTKDEVMQAGKIKLMCLEGLHRFEQVLPNDPNMLAELLSIAASI